MARDLLLEIGMEELPARFLLPAMEQMEALARGKLQEVRLGFQEISTYGTPRRLALYVHALEEEQVELVEEVKGPAAKAAFGPEGAPTRAAEGFARSQGVRVEELERRTIPGGEYVFALKKSPGRPAMDILKGMLPELITSLNFPRPMRWGGHELRFARPIHWLVALYGGTVVEIELEHLQGGRNTYGHRFLSPGPIALEDPTQYLPRLEDAYVIAERHRRKALIWEGIQELAKGAGGWVEEDAELLEEVTDLLEYPTPLLGSFDPAFLQLPVEVLTTPMREHQRYFPVRGDQEKLLPFFVTVRNGISDHLELVRQGNEKVLRARLADATFFYREDLKVPLPELVEKLKGVVFQESLGSVHAKVGRLVALTRWLGERQELPDPVVDNAARAALLSKADLVTSMVYEFPELQGIMGAHYAAHAGEGQAVCLAIREHYRPRFSGDAPPGTLEGALVGLADKLDNLAGSFRAGIQPTGSQDPYALRRQAHGVVLTLLAHGLGLSLAAALDYASGLYDNVAEARSWLECREDLAAFFRQRLENVLEERGIRYDVAAAVLATGWEDPLDVLKRAGALTAFLAEPGCDVLLTALNRAQNLSRQAVAGMEVRPELFQEEAEGRLHGAFLAVRKGVEEALAAGEYLGALRLGIALGEPIDNFFEAVLVMAEDQEVRGNRLALLKKVADLYTGLADLHRLVPGPGKK